MFTTYSISQDLANVALGIKTPWLIVNSSQVVDVYPSRATARAAKSNMTEGKVVSMNEITIAVEEIAVEETAVEEIEVKVTPVEETAVEEIAIEEATPFGFEEHGLTHCPVCGTHLSNGVGEHGQKVNGKPVKHARFKYCCLACGVEFGPAIESKTEKALKAKVEPKNIENRSAVKKPCRLVWDLADAMVGASRKDVIAAAEAKGVAYYTARTQYQLWTQVQKEMAAREKAVTK